MNTTVNVWRSIAYNQEQLREWAIAWSRRHERIAIGWSRIGDIRQQGYGSPDEISAAIRSQYPGNRNASAGGRNLWDFYAAIKPGDLVILSSGKRREVVFEVQGEYEWREAQAHEYSHQRRARVRHLNPDDLWNLAGAGAASGQSTRWTLFRCRQPVEKARFIEMEAIRGPRGEHATHLRLDWAGALRNTEEGTSVDLQHEILESRDPTGEER